MTSYHILLLLLNIRLAVHIPGSHPIILKYGDSSCYIVILRMNLKFMIYCRGKHASIGKVNEVQNDMGNDEDIYVDEYD